jgi:aminoglycoside phosphotransferase (APT) family kinase protein
VTTRQRPRPAWNELPFGVREAVEGVIGAPIVASESRAGGWSPGSADLVTAADGRRAFVKAADGRVNARTVAMHRREAEVLRLLDDGPAPRLLGEVDAPPWFGLVVEAIAGRHPLTDSETDTVAVLDAVAELPAAPEGADLGRIEDELADAALGWRRLHEDGIGVGADLVRLGALAAGLPEAVRGDSVVHGDLRLDNALIDAEGRGRLIDWPSAVVGPRWFDAVTYLMDVRHLGGPIGAGLLHPVLRDVPAEHLDVLLAVLGAYFLDSARRPEASGLEGLRAYQRAQGRTVLAWLLERRSDLR